MMRRKNQKGKTEVFDLEVLENQLMRDAKAVGLSKDSVALITKRVSKEIAKWVKDKEVITKDDLYRKIAKETRQYSQDLAYVYENRDKII